MFPHFETLLAACVTSTPPPALANQPNQKSLFLQLPYDLLTCIIDVVTYPGRVSDYKTLSALALTNSALLDVCRRKQFSTIAFNMRRINMPARAKSFVCLLESNPNLQKYVQSLFFGDNVFYPSFIRDADVVHVGDIQDRTQYYSHFEMKKNISRGILYGPKDDEEFVSEALTKLKCLNSVEISFLYANIDWEWASLILRAGLTNLLVQPYIRSLHIHGVWNIPMELLRRFRSLEELCIAASSISPPIGSEISAPDLTTLQFPSPPPHTLGRKQRLDIISLNDVGYCGMHPLLDHWRNQSNEPGFVDMSRPAHIDLAFDRLEESVILQQLVGNSASYVKTLCLDTSELSFTIDIPLSSEEDYIEHYDDYDAFKTYFPTLNARLDDVSYLNNLETLQLYITYWERATGIAESGFHPDEELRWELKLLQRVPSEYLKDITLNVKVGGYTSIFQNAFTEFHSDQEFIWNDWAKEFRLPKYRALQKVSIRVYGLETFDSGNPCLSLNQSIVDRALEQLCRNPVSRKEDGCCIDVQCYIVRLHCLIY
ncbi:hypothetical protein HYPSUDRAFT_53562 [Hypholoma sublateritium FD-334 SS-4]|uniref:Uncharacterized protein n=1 Tax=Hypholoma sublateritium (strain FD-334 SS-4) TaxID=945553 RepID=A0A0D2LC25_HYPSF|nr:hypothetical protein HYPSUDRAFT_53562 [Hypholoma sublateritium FD-334 SS-4]